MEKGSCSEGGSGARDSRRLKHSLAGDLLRLLRSALARRLLVLLEAFFCLFLTFVYREESGRVGVVFIFSFLSFRSSSFPRRAASPPPLSQRSPKIPFSLFPASTRVACISSSVFPVPDIVFFLALEER